MIHSLKITSGWPVEKLPAFKDKRLFRFKPGVTVIFGPNGCGKTTLLRFLGAYSGCPEHGGWSEPVRAWGARDKKYPGRFSTTLGSSKDVSARVAWDGTATFMHLAHESDKPMIAFGMEHDTLDDMTQIGLTMSKASAGQNRLVRLNKVLESLAKDVPDLAKIKPKHDGESKVVGDFATYVKRLSRKGPVTALLDEPDRSLDITNQVLFWTRIVPAMGRKLQVIATSHNPIALFTPGAEFVDMTDGYSGSARQSLLDVIAGVHGGPSANAS